MIRVPFLWTRRTIRKYLRQYYQDLIKAIESRGITMAGMNRAGSVHWRVSGSTNHKHCYISVYYHPYDSFTILSASVMRNDKTIGALYNILEINCGFHLDPDALLRKKGRGIPSAEELADRLCKSAALYEEAVKQIKSDPDLRPIYSRLERMAAEQNRDRLIESFKKLIEQKTKPRR